MDVNLLEQLVGLMSANDVNTIDVRDGERRVIIKRGAPAASAPSQFAFPFGAPAGAPPAAAAPPPAVAADPDAGLIPIKSELVGTFYSKPKPDEKPFVTVGGKVDEETVVCVVEAMKNYIPVKAECHGTIARAMLPDGAPVQYGTILFLVRPSDG
jgi:acetyl-CoA carboxylase biotin carboxyl carrier protein